MRCQVGRTAAEPTGVLVTARRTDLSMSPTEIGYMSRPRSSTPTEWVSAPTAR